MNTLHAADKQRMSVQRTEVIMPVIALENTRAVLKVMSNNVL